MATAAPEAAPQATLLQPNPSISELVDASAPQQIISSLSAHKINPCYVMNETILMGGPAGRRIRFETYSNETQMLRIKALMDNDLSEPYSIFTYRYFINNWPHLCILAIDVESEENAAADAQPQTAAGSNGTNSSTITTAKPEHIIGAIVCKCDEHKSHFTGTNMRGYIAMLAVDPRCRKLGIGSELVERAIKVMAEQHDCREVALETESVNKGALRLYENLGFVREKRLHRYYLNGGDAFRLILQLD